MGVAMRAKFRVTSVERFAGGNEKLKMTAVCRNSYPAGGNDENNTFALYTPSASLEMTITNPLLVGLQNPGDEFYVDFSPVQK